MNCSCWINWLAIWVVASIGAAGWWAWWRLEQKLIYNEESGLKILSFKKGELILLTSQEPQTFGCFEALPGYKNPNVGELIKEYVETRKFATRPKDIQGIEEEKMNPGFDEIADWLMANKYVKDLNSSVLHVKDPVN